MIKNERQYRITKAQAAKFEQALAEQYAAGIPSNIHPLLAKAQHEAIESQLEDLRTQVAEYDALRKGQRHILELNSWDELPQALVQARIASGLSQKELAERLGLKEQQIQRYESTNYLGASLERVKEIMNALDLKIREDVFLPTAQVSFKTLIRRLQSVGLKRDFIMKRLLPASIVAEADDQSEHASDSLALQSAAIAGRAFGLTPTTIFATNSLRLNTAALNQARFKLSGKTNEAATTAYTVYAHYLALLALEATPALVRQPVPTDAEEVRKAVTSRYEELSFKSLLEYMWDLGIVVLPLNDSGAFHGACWRVGGRNVVVLKQQTQSQARWLNDGLHELGHAGQEPERDELAVIEESEPLKRNKEFPEEASAIAFADAVALEGRGDDLAQQCVEAAGGSVERLKATVPKVALAQGVPVDVLANYVAYRLSQQKINWWGGATNLQVTTPSPWETARNLFLEKVSLQHLNEVDRGLLLRALSDEEA